MALAIGPRIDPGAAIHCKSRHTGWLYRAMKPHVRRGRAAKEKRIARAKARRAASLKPAA